MSDSVKTDKKVHTILVVDDSAYVRRMIRFALPSQSFKIIEAVDGLDAIKCFDRHSIDLLISDLKMPNMDGFALIRTLRSRPGFEYLPIIMLTGQSSDKCREEAKEVGVSAFIEKPFVPEQISGLIQSIFS